MSISFHDGVLRASTLTRTASKGALLLFSVLVVSEIARALGVTETTPRVVRTTFILFTILAIGAAVVEHYLAATRELQRLNEELERRLAGKAEEIKSTYARIEEAKREWALVSERQRILADMHDGVGASLIGLLRHVQSGKADGASIEKRVQEVLQEVRIAIDALQPRDGDLAAVLGALRYRLDDVIRSSGVKLVWEVEELPALEELSPAAIFCVQRILLEAITNVLKHAQARELRVAARASGTGIEIRISDDGAGFDPARRADGLGLASMRARAHRIGAHLAIRSKPGAGTEVVLRLPGGRAVLRAA
jgi:signal transduction histidine kinase